MLKKTLALLIFWGGIISLANSQPECFTEFSTGQFNKGDTIEAFYFMAAVYPNPDKKGVITFLSPIFQINARKSDTTWSRRGIGLFRYGIVEFKDSIKSQNPTFDVTYYADYGGIVTKGFNPSRRVHINAFCLNELRKFYYKQASKGKDEAVYMDDFVYELTGFKDNDFDTLEIKKYEGDLSKPAMIKEFLKSTK